MNYDTPEKVTKTTIDLSDNYFKKIFSSTDFNRQLNFCLNVFLLI